MNCNKKISNTCGTKNYATCIYYELELPDFSLIEDECVTLEDTTQDIYNLIADIRGQIDLSDLGDDCLTYILDSENRKVIKNVLIKIEEKVCELSDRVNTLEMTSICDMPISGCDFDLGTLADQCANQPSTLKELLQILINQHNS